MVRGRCQLICVGHQHDEAKNFTEDRYTPPTYAEPVIEGLSSLLRLNQDRPAHPLMPRPTFIAPTRLRL